MAREPTVLLPGGCPCLHLNGANLLEGLAATSTKGKFPTRILGFPRATTWGIWAGRDAIQTCPKSKERAERGSSLREGATGSPRDSPPPTPPLTREPVSARVPAFYAGIPAPQSPLERTTRGRTRPVLSAPDLRPHIFSPQGLLPPRHKRPASPATLRTTDGQ